MPPHCLKALCGLVALAAATGAAGQSLAGDAPPATPPNPAPAAIQAPVRAPSLSLSPAVIMVRARPGQGTTQTLTIANGMSDELRFEVETQDVVVKDGKRTFVPAGQVASGIALGAVAAPSSATVKPGQTASVAVTLTIPQNTTQRAVVVFFRAKMAPTQGGSVGLGAALGALVTFTLSDDFQVEPGPITVAAQTATANAVFSEEVRNTGTEPVIPKGVLAVLNLAGKRVAKAVFEPQRLLPGEKLVFSVSSPDLLPPGQYRAISTFEYEGKVVTGTGEFTVSE